MPSPTANRKAHADTLPGFIKPPKPKSRPINQLTLRELNDLHNHNARILSGPYVHSPVHTLPHIHHNTHPVFFLPSPRIQHIPSLFSSPSTSTYVQRIAAEQDAIEARLAALIEQENIESIRVGIKNTSISNDEDMNIDADSEPSLPRPIAAKRRALMRYVRVSCAKPFYSISY